MADLGPHFFYPNDADRTEFREDFRPTLAQLLALLRSGEPLTADMRRWLADLIDPAGKTPMQLTIERRNGRGPLPSSALRNRLRDLAMEIEVLVDGGVKLESAIAQVASGEGAPGRSTLMKAWAALKEEQRIMDLHRDPEWEAWVAEEQRKETERLRQSNSSG